MIKLTVPRLSVVEEDSMSRASKLSLKASNSVESDMKRISRTSKNLRKSKVTTPIRAILTCWARKGKCILFNGRKVISYRAFIELQMLWREPFIIKVQMISPNTAATEIESVVSRTASKSFSCSGSTIWGRFTAILKESAQKASVRLSTGNSSVFLKWSNSWSVPAWEMLSGLVW